MQSEGDGEQLSVAEGINAQLLMVSSPDYKTRVSTSDEPLCHGTPIKKELEHIHTWLGG